MGSLVKHLCGDGRIHCSFHATRNDEYGARSGRFASANPNLQQIPSLGGEGFQGDDEYFGKLARGPFIPEDGHLWGKIDWSQIEYRNLAHFASGEGSDELRRKYNTDPETDYHQYVMDLTSLRRRPAKSLNFGIVFGMGAKKMVKTFGWSQEYCDDVLELYHSKAPYVKATMRAVERVAVRRGYIKTFLGRRSHLVADRESYKMLNRLLQGSAADQMKKAMIDSYAAGVFNILVPHLTVHDELNVSIPNNRNGREAFEAMHHIMETCATLRVPIRADAKVGKNWADAEVNPTINNWKEFIAA